MKKFVSFWDLILEEVYFDYGIQDWQITERQMGMSVWPIVANHYRGKFKRGVKKFAYRCDTLTFKSASDQLV